MTESADLIRAVTTAADEAGLHAPAPAMLLELQSLLGTLSACATAATQGGRRPFRPDAQWEAALGALGFAVCNLADQTGIDIVAAILRRAAQVQASAQAPRGDEPAAWPFGD